MITTPTPPPDLRRLAEAATPGEWSRCGDARGGCECRLVFAEHAAVAQACSCVDADSMGEGYTEKQAKANAAFIAAANPQAVIGLLDERDKVVGIATSALRDDELRAALLNERGEGEPPSEGWEYQACAGWGMCWVRGGGPDDWIAVTRKPAGGWYVRLGAAFANRSREFAISIGTARDAMARVDAALAGGKS